MKRIELYRHMIEAQDFHAPIGKLLGMRFTAIEEGSGTIEMETRPEFFNSQGFVQGGIIACLADAVMGAAFGSGLDEKIIFTSIEFQIHFFLPINKGRIIAMGQLILQGNRTAFTE